MKKELKNRGGITLIALVITIIVLLILAGVTINLVLNGGIIGQAQNAKTVTELEQEKEGLQLRIAELEIELYKISDKNSQEYINKNRELIELKNEILLKTIAAYKVDPYYVYNKVGWELIGSYLANIIKSESGIDSLGYAAYSVKNGWSGDSASLSLPFRNALEEITRVHGDFYVEINGLYTYGGCDWFELKLVPGITTDLHNLDPSFEARRDLWRSRNQDHLQKGYRPSSF